MTAEVLYLVNGNYNNESSFRRTHLEKGVLILDERRDLVHSPLYPPNLFLPIGSLRQKIMLETFMEDPERRLHVNEFIEEREDIFSLPSHVRKTVWHLRLKLGDMGTDPRKRSTVFSLIHSGPEGYSLTPYEYIDLNFHRLPILHAIKPYDPCKGIQPEKIAIQPEFKNQQPMLSSWKYDFSYFPGKRKPIRALE